VARLSFKASTTAWRIASLLAILIAGGWVLYTFPPVTSGFYPQCVFKQATGLDCPGCGTTRALHALVHGRFGEALHFNPLLFVFIAVAACMLPSLLRGESARFVYTRWFGWGSVVVICGWWIGRNLWWPLA